MGWKWIVLKSSLSAPFVTEVLQLFWSQDGLKTVYFVFNLSFNFYPSAQLFFTEKPREAIHTK